MSKTKDNQENKENRESRYIKEYDLISPTGWAVLDLLEGLEREKDGGLISLKHLQYLKRRDIINCIGDYKTVYAENFSKQADNQTFAEFIAANHSWIIDRQISNNPNVILIQWILDEFVKLGLISYKNNQQLFFYRFFPGCRRYKITQKGVEFQMKHRELEKLKRKLEAL